MSETIKSIELETKPDFDQCMQRVLAWYEQEIIDRPPIRFSAHNAEYNAVSTLRGRSWPNLEAKWMDAEFQLEFFIASMAQRKFLAETFPVYWPNLGPEIFSALFGGELIFEQVTSYYRPSVIQWSDADRLQFDKENRYFKKLEEMTRLALSLCQGQFLVGYTDLHGGVDCAAAWRDPQQFCLDLLDSPQEAKMLIAKAAAEFQGVYDHFHALLKRHHQPSVTWLGVPSFGKMHIPSCDFASLLSKQQFEEFCLPITQAEVKHMTHNIFHVDGKGVAKNLPLLLEIPEINGIQYVQGVGDDQPIMQWIRDLQMIQQAGKSLVVDIALDELEPFMEALKPEGVLLCLDAEEELQPQIIQRVARWRG